MTDLTPTGHNPATLDRLRAIFLADTKPRTDYWQSRADLAAYDATFGERIGWKWDAVLRDLERRGWRLPPGDVLDWGCGSGIASRRVLAWAGAIGGRRLWLHDRSALAREFATDRARAELPATVVEPWRAGNPAPAVLVVSHVLNELDAADRAALLRLARGANVVLWVEPGTFADSRALIAVREELRSKLTAVAPCRHQGACGLLAPGNERHWCHQFAAPPPGLMADPDWVRFAQQAQIDLRSLPYSYLVLERLSGCETPSDTPSPGVPPLRDTGLSLDGERQAVSSDASASPPRGRGRPRVVPGTGEGEAVAISGASRILGRPRVYKGYLRLLNCDATGVREVELQKRDDPALFRQLRAGEADTVQDWVLAGNRVVGQRTMTL